MSVENRKKCGEKIKIHAGNRQDKNSPFRYFLGKSNSASRVKLYGHSLLTLEYLTELWDSQAGICPYTNLKMKLPKNTLEYHSKISRCPTRASLVRIDSSKGYVPGNVEFVCYTINLAKNTFSREEMLEFISKIKNAGNNPGIQ
jgi:hypothetical protein